MKRNVFLMLVLLLAGLTLASQPASVSAQDPQPPWQGKLIAAAEMFRFNPGTNSMSLEAVLPPNDPNPASMVGVYGLNAHWVSLSAFNHVVAASSVQFSAGTNLSTDPPPLWQGTALRNCPIYTLGANRTLEQIGTLPTVGGTVGVYAIGDGYAQISAWLHFVAVDCLSGSFNQGAQPASIPTPAQWVDTLRIPIQTLSLPGGEVRLYEEAPSSAEPYMIAAASAVAIDGPIPAGDVVAGGIVVYYFWVVSDGPQNLAAMVVTGVEGVRAWAAQQPAFQSQIVAPVAPWQAFPDMAAVTAALASVPVLGDEVTLEGDFNELELAGFDAAGNFLLRGYDEAAVMVTSPASICVLQNDQCALVIPVPTDGELNHALERHGAKALVVFEYVTTHPEEVSCGSVSGRCLIIGRIAGVGVGVIVYVNEGTSMAPAFGRVVTVLGGSRVKVHQFRISTCAEWRVYPPPVFEEPVYRPIPEGAGLCLERGNTQ